MSSRFVRLVGLALLIPTVAWTQTPAAPTLVLKLAPGDLLRIEVKDEPTLSGQFAIGADGAVLLPALGLVHAAGRPFPDVRDELVQSYGKQLVAPVIRITPMVRVAVLGEVRVPGLYPVDPTLTVAEVIATAGGLTPMANSGSVSLVRDGHATAAPNGAAWTALNQSLQSGDQIVVSRKSWMSENTPFLLGALGSVAAAAIAGIIVR